MERWSSRWGALWALIGGAVGLGNFLRFPFQAARWGGGAFLVPYLVALLVVGLPMVWIEMRLGQAGAQSGARSAPALLRTLAGKSGWLIGLLAVYVSLAVASYYAYLTGWTLGYTYHALLGTFSGKDLETLKGFHSEFIHKQSWIFWLLTWLLTGAILHGGLQHGVERLNRYGMPLLFLLGIGLASGTLFLGPTGRCPTCDPKEGLLYLYLPRWTALQEPAVWLAAAGQVFFSIGVGFAMYPVYAAYSGSAPILAQGTYTVAANTFAEVVLGGLIVIPLTTAFLGLPYVQQQAGFGMGFEVMPYVLEAWGGRLLTAAWYVLLFLAGLSSLLAMGWVVLTWLAETLGGQPQRWTVPFIGVSLLLGLPPLLGYAEDTLNLYDYWAGTFLLVLAALGHWWLFRQAARQGLVSLEVAGPFRWIISWLTPLFLGLILLGSCLQPVAGDWIGAWKSLWETGHWPWAEEALPVWLAHHTFRSPWNALGLALLLGALGLIFTLRRR
ncbi:MAG: hypothetical protein ABDH91_04730 [Bacteroidia bacterium]